MILLPIKICIHFIILQKTIFTKINAICHSFKKYRTVTYNRYN